MAPDPKVGNLFSRTNYMKKRFYNTTFRHTCGESQAVGVYGRLIHTYENTQTLLPLAGARRAEKSGKVASPKSSHVSLLSVAFMSPLTSAFSFCPFLLDPSPFPLSPLSSSIAARSSSPSPCWFRPLRALLSQRPISYHYYRHYYRQEQCLVRGHQCLAIRVHRTCLVGRCALHTYCIAI